MPNNTPTYALTNGSLPSGLSLSSSGIISGTLGHVSLTTTLNFVITAYDGVGGVSPATFTYTVLAIDQTLVWNTPIGSLGSAKTLTTITPIQLSVTDPHGRLISYSLTSGTLPSGLSMSSSGLITGYLSAVSTDTVSSFLITASNGAGGLSPASFNYTVQYYDYPPVWTMSSTLGTFGVNRVVGIQLSATDPSGNSLSYTVMSGTIMPDITLSASGFLSGTVNPSVSPGPFSTLLPSQFPAWVTGSNLGTYVSGSTLQTSIQATANFGTVISSYFLTDGQVLPVGLILGVTGSLAGVIPSISNNTQGISLAPCIWNTPSGVLAVLSTNLGGNTSISVSLSASPGTGTIISRYNMRDGYVLPFGLNLNTQTGVISGIVAEDTNPADTYTPPAYPPTWQSSGNLAILTANSSFSTTLQASPYVGRSITWYGLADNNVLPYGFLLDSTSGVLSGFTGLSSVVGDTYVMPPNPPTWLTFGTMAVVTEFTTATITATLQASAFSGRNMSCYALTDNNVLPYGFILNPSTGVISGNFSEDTIVNDPYIPPTNPPTWTTVTGALATLTEYSSLALTLHATAYSTRTVSCYQVTDNSVMPYGFILNPTTGVILGNYTEDTIPHDPPVYPMSPPAWVSSGTLATLLNYSTYSITLQATPASSRNISSYNMLDAYVLPTGFILNTQTGILTGVTTENFNPADVYVPPSNPPIWISNTGTLATLTEYSSFSATLQATPYIGRNIRCYQVTDNNVLPYGFILNPTTGVVLGNYTEDTIPHDPQVYPMNPPVWVSNGTLATVIEYSSFTTTLQATPSTGRVISSYNLRDNYILPFGYILNPQTGVLTGNTTENFNPLDPYIPPINPPSWITPGSLTNVSSYSTYTATLQATPYTGRNITCYGLVDTNVLPFNFILNPVTGVLTGSLTDDTIIGNAYIPPTNPPTWITGSTLPTLKEYSSITITLQATPLSGRNIICYGLIDGSIFPYNFILNPTTGVLSGSLIEDNISGDAYIPPTNPPTWVTSGTLATLLEYASFTTTLQATGYSTRTVSCYAVTDNSVLPCGFILNSSNGILTGYVTDATNPGDTSIGIPNPPTWSMSGTLATVIEYGNFTTTLQATPLTGRNIISYNVIDGDVLPFGYILNTQTGVITGNTTEDFNPLDTYLPPSNPPVWASISGILATLTEYSSFTATLQATASSGRNIKCYQVTDNSVMPYGFILNPTTGVVLGNFTEDTIPHDPQVYPMNPPVWVSSGTLNTLAEYSSLSITLQATPASGRSIIGYNILDDYVLPFGYILNTQTGIISGTVLEDFNPLNSYIPPTNPPTWISAGTLATLGEYVSFTTTLQVTPSSGRSITCYGLVDNTVLPYGLILNPNTGIISGTTPEDLNILDTYIPPIHPPSWVTSPFLTTLIEFSGTTFSTTLQATPYTGKTITCYGLADKNVLPYGFILDSITGILSGVFTEDTITSDAYIPPIHPPTWTTVTGALATLTEYSSFTATIQATPYSGRTITCYVITDNSAMPNGFLLNPSTGVITGNYTEDTIPGDPLIPILNPPSWSSAGILPPVTEFGTYSTTLQATPFSGRTLSYNLQDGNVLPIGYILNTQTGVLSGVTTEDFNPLDTYVPPSNPPSWNTSGTIGSYTKNSSITVTVSATPYSGRTIAAYFTADGSQLPTGLVLNAQTGAISGVTPTVAATYTVHAYVIDSALAVSTTNFSFIIT
jgi:hypothetical protein